jgi:hypothetical protein
MRNRNPFSSSVFLLASLFCLLGAGTSCTALAQESGAADQKNNPPANAGRKKQPNNAHPGIPPGNPIPKTWKSEEIERARHQTGALTTDIGGVRNSQGEPVAPPMLERGARRYALIVANQKYTELAPLQTPRLDAEALLDVLSANGFITQIYYDLGLEQFRQAVEKFADPLRPEDFVLFYYAGHGIEYHGINALLPVDFKFSDLDVFESKGYRLDDVRNLLTRGNRQALIIVDSCRTSPFDNKAETGAPALAHLTPGNSEGLAFSATEGDSAFDGSGWTRSPFNRAFTYAFRQSELGLRSAVELARSILIFSTAGEQIPQVQFGLGFKDATIASFEHPNGFAKTPLRDQVFFSPEREQLQVLETIHRHNAPKDSVGLNFDTAQVFTLEHKWILRHHSDQLPWDDKTQTEAIHFLEHQLRADALQPPDREIWSALKSAQPPADLIWFAEEVAFRGADLPVLFEAVPDDQKKLLVSPEISKSKVVGHSLLGYLDAHNLRTTRWEEVDSNDLPEIGTWRQSVGSWSTGAVLPDASIQGNGLFWSLAQACAAVSVDSGTECLKVSANSKAAKFDSKQRHILALLFNLAAVHRVAYQAWLPRALSAESNSRPEVFADALEALSTNRLRLAPAKAFDQFENDSAKGLTCENLAEVSGAMKDDPLDPIAYTHRSYCGPTEGLTQQLRNSWYSDNTDAQGAEIYAIVDYLNAAFGNPNQTAFSSGALQSLLESPDWTPESSGDLDEFLPIGRMYIDPVRSCQAGALWSRAENQQFHAAESDIQYKLTRSVLDLRADAAQSLFDVSAARFYLAALSALDSNNSAPRFDEYPKKFIRSCVNTLLQGDSGAGNIFCSAIDLELSFDPSRMWEDSNEEIVDNYILKAIWEALGGRNKEAAQTLTDAGKGLDKLLANPIKGHEDRTRDSVAVYRRSLDGAKIFLQRLKGDKTDSAPQGHWLGNFFPFIERGCGMLPEIR